jgi:hypothetical protein
LLLRYYRLLPPRRQLVVFGVHIPELERDAKRVTTTSAREYEVGASATLSCVGDPKRDDNAAYLGHFCNDGSMCNSQDDVSDYRMKSLACANAASVTLEGCQLATQATKAISRNEEVLVTYGEDYWLSHLSNNISINSIVVSNPVDEVAGIGEKLTADLTNDEAITFEAKSSTNLTEYKKNKISSINVKSKSRGKSTQKGFGRT